MLKIDNYKARGLLFKDNFSLEWELIIVRNLVYFKMNWAWQLIFFIIIIFWYGKSLTLNSQISTLGTNFKFRTWLGKGDAYLFFVNHEQMDIHF